MKRLWVLPLAATAWTSAAVAQDLTVSGFVAFEAAYGENYDLERMFNPAFGQPGQPPFIEETSQVPDLDFGVDARLNFDYANATKSGLEYGAHFELDFYKSDRSYTLPTTLPTALILSDPRQTAFVLSYQTTDRLGPDAVAFNDGYVFINSSLGHVKLGDTGTAGEASNQLNVPFLAPGALEIDNYAPLELEQVFYANSFLGVDFEASVDDDANWALGLGYGADVGGVAVALGLSAADETLAGSISASAGGLTAGMNYAMEEIGHTKEYVAAGLSYAAGPLAVGLGVETEITHEALESNVVGGIAIFDTSDLELYETNVFFGATYEVADGLTFGLGVANLDSDSLANRSLTVSGVGGSVAGISGRYIDDSGATFSEGRTWVAGASVKVSF